MLFVFRMLLLELFDGLLHHAGGMQGIDVQVGHPFCVRGDLLQVERFGPATPAQHKTAAIANPK